MLLIVSIPDLCLLSYFKTVFYFVGVCIDHTRRLAVMSCVCQLITLLQLFTSEGTVTEEMLIYETVHAAIALP